MDLLAGLLTRFMVFLNLMQMLITIHIRCIIKIMILVQSSNLRFNVVYYKFKIARLVVDSVTVYIILLILSWLLI